MKSHSSPAPLKIWAEQTLEEQYDSGQDLNTDYYDEQITNKQYKPL